MIKLYGLMQILLYKTVYQIFSITIALPFLKMLIIQFKIIFYQPSILMIWIRKEYVLQYFLYQKVLEISVILKIGAIQKRPN